MTLLPPVGGRLQDMIDRSVLVTLPCYLAFRSLASSPDEAAPDAQAA